MGISSSCSKIRHATDSIRFAAAVSTHYLAEAALDWLDEGAACPGRGNGYRDAYGCGWLAFAPDSRK